MRSVISLILVYCLAITSVFAQSVNPNDTLKIGKASSSSDKGLTFDTNDGVSNKKLLIEKISKKLKFDGNTFQIGDGSSSSDKELIIAGALKSLKYNGTSGEFEFNDDVKLSGILKADFLQAVNTEVGINSLLRASQGIKVGAGANEIRVNAGNLEFSNDGVLYKKFGTGSGGGSTGVNLLANDSFEDGISTGWTSSGGTFSQQTYAIGAEGDLKYGRFISTTSGQYIEQIVSVPTNFSAGCQADFKKVNVSTAGLFKVQALDVSNNVLAEQVIGVSAWIKVPTISFPCPASGVNNLKLRLTSLATGTIEFDKGYVGSNQNLVNISQARLVGTVSFSNCSAPWSTTSATFVNFPASTGCTYVTSGEAVSDSSFGTTQLPSIKFKTLPAGDYRVEYEGFLYGIGAGNASAFRFSDGVNVSREASHVQTASSSGAATGMSHTMSYATVQTNVSLNIQAAVSTGATAQVYHAVGAPAGVIKVWYFPSQSEVAVSNEQSSWFIDANIGGANPAIPNIGATTYTAITDASLDMVINSMKGSALAQIACASGTSSSGLTCTSANESIGIAFIPPSAGRYKACFSFSNFYSGSTTTFQLVETANNSDVIISEGGERMFNTDNTGVVYSALKVCGNFIFSNTDKKTIKLMFEGGGASNSIYADRNSSLGQRDIHISVENMSFPQGRPILTGGQLLVKGASPGLSYESFTASFGTTNGNTPCTTNPCSYLGQMGNAITSIGRASAGFFSINTSRTYSNLHCIIQANGGGGSFVQVRPISICTNCNVFNFEIANSIASANSDGYGIVSCTGSY